MELPTRFESAKVDVSPLKEPLQFEFSGKVVPNRFLKGAMTERLSSWDLKNLTARGIPSNEMINVYKQWGEGGLGMILTGNIHFEYDHLEAAGNAIIPRDAPFHGERFEQFQELARQAKAQGNLILGQLSHAGRQVSEKIQKHPISASDVQLEGVHFGMTFGKPHAASEKEITQIIEGFAHAAEYLEKAGYDGVELHGAFGYLLAQFISPVTNRRTDKYGGSLENRARLILEITREIRKRTRPDFVLGFKLNSANFANDGFDENEAKGLLEILQENRFDFVELSGGSYEHVDAFAYKRESTRKREAYFIDFAQLIKPLLRGTKLYITGGFKTAAAMVDSLQFGDGVGLARAVAQEPYLVKDILEGKVTSAIQQKIDSQNFGLTTVVAGTQLRQIGKGQQPIDLSKGENVEAFMKDMAVWGDLMAKDVEGVYYGFVDITSVPPVPYLAL